MSNLKDNEGIVIKEGDVLFYTERPHSNYADSLVHVYSDAGALKVGTLVGEWEGSYVSYPNSPSESDLELTSYGLSCTLKQTGQCENMNVIPGLTIDQATIEFANQHYPLDAPDLCMWIRDDDGNYNTACDNMHCFIDGSVKDNRYSFCPYCGCAIKEVPLPGN